MTFPRSSDRYSRVLSGRSLTEAILSKDCPETFAGHIQEEMKNRKMAMPAFNVRMGNLLFFVYFSFPNLRP
jgi:hypothetical protein